MTVAAPPASPPPPKLRTVLDYVPCEACLQEPSDEQELLCSICRRLDRSVTVKRVEHRTFIVVTPLPPPAPEPEVIPPAAAAEAEMPMMLASTSDVAEAVATAVLAGAHEAKAPEPLATPPARPPVRVLDAASAADAPDVTQTTIDVLVEPLDLPPASPPGEGVAEVATLAAAAAVAGAEVAAESDEDAGGFDFTDDGPPEDAFDFGSDERPAAAPPPPPPPAGEDEEPAGASAFTFTPPPRDEAPPVEEAPAQAEVVEAPREEESPWRRPVEDDWMRETQPARAEEPWPEERSAPPPPQEEPVETLEIVEDEEPARETGGEIPPAESQWNVEGLTGGRPVAQDGEEIVETTIVEESEEPWPDERATPPSEASAPSGAWESPAASQEDFAVADLDGVKPFDAERLANVGVMRGNDLTGRDPWQLADATGLSAKRLEKWIWVAEMVRVAGVPFAAAEALVGSGVKGVDGLRVLDPERGARDANKKLAKSATKVSPDDVRAWQART